MKKALITGITGQDGSYLTELLLEKGYEVHGIIRRASSFNTHRVDHLYEDRLEGDPKMILHYGDLTDSSSLNRILERVRDCFLSLGSDRAVAYRKGGRDDAPAERSDPAMAVVIQQQIHPEAAGVLFTVNEDRSLVADIIESFAANVTGDAQAVPGAGALTGRTITILDHTYDIQENDPGDGGGVVFGRDVIAGGADDDEDARWAGAGLQVTATAVTVQRDDEEDRLELSPPSDPLRQSKAVFVLVPVLSLVVMAVVRAIHRRKRRALKATG